MGQNHVLSIHKSPFPHFASFLRIFFSQPAGIPCTLFFLLKPAHAAEQPNTPSQLLPCPQNTRLAQLEKLCYRLKKNADERTGWANMKKIFSKNAQYQKIDVLQSNRNKRYKYKEFLVEGVRNLNEARRSGWEFSSLLYTDEVPLSGWAREFLANVKTQENFILTHELLQELSRKDDASELMAVVKMREDSFDTLALPENPLLAVFDRPSNRGNLGTLIRSCDALGVNGLLVTGHAVDLYDPEVVTSGMGSFFRMPAVRLSDNAQVKAAIESLRNRYPGFRVIATTAHKQTPIYEEKLDGPCLVMIGNETEGLCRAFYDLADTTVSIPMAPTSSASSFNVSCAATVVLYEIIRQRQKAGNAGW